MQVIWQTSFSPGVFCPVQCAHGNWRNQRHPRIAQTGSRRKRSRGSELILHAGDLGSEEVLRALEAPCARGGRARQRGPGCRGRSHVEVAECAEKSFYILHRLADLDLKPKAACIAAVIYGHSHQPLIEWRDGVLFFNPGSAGPRRFSLPVTVGRIEIVEIVRNVS